MLMDYKQYLVLLLQLSLWPKVHCQVDGDVRIVGTSSGRIQLYYSGQWGSVCTDHFNHNEALVICRQLGLQTHPVQLHPYTRSADPVSLHYVTCVGSESVISDCDIPHWGLDDNDTCSNNQDAGLQCGPTPTTTTTEAVPDGTVRLSGADEDAISGRVELRWAGLWGTVCYGQFTNSEATVVCRQLGHVHEKFTIRSSSYYGQGNGNIWHVSCHGNETTINECSVVQDRVHCDSHIQDVGITCGLSDESLPTVKPDSDGINLWTYMYFVIPIVIMGIVSAVIFIICYRRAKQQRQLEVEEMRNQGHRTHRSRPPDASSPRMSEQERQLKIQHQMRMRNSLRTMHAREAAMRSGELQMTNVTDTSDGNCVVSNPSPRGTQLHNYMSSCEERPIFTTQTSSDPWTPQNTTPTPTDPINDPWVPQMNTQTSTTQNSDVLQQSQGNNTTTTTLQVPAPTRFYRYPSHDSAPTLPSYTTEFESPYPPSYDSLFSQEVDSNGRVIPVTPLHRRSPSARSDNNTPKTMDTEL